MSMKEECEKIIELINLISKKYEVKENKPLTRFEELTIKIKEIPELEHLFVDDPDVEYNYNKNNKCKKYTHLLKCIILTSKYNFLNEYIDLYLNENPEAIKDTNEKQYSALMIAARNSNNFSTFETVEILLEHKADVNYKCKNGITAIMCASIYSKTESSEETVEILLNYGADPNIESKCNFTALTYCISNMETTTIKTLEMLMNCMNNCDIKIKGEKLIKILWDKYIYPAELIILAIKKGANPNDADPRLNRFAELYRQ